MGDGIIEEGIGVNPKEVWLCRELAELLLEGGIELVRDKGTVEARNTGSEAEFDEGNHREILDTLIFKICDR